MAPTRLSKRGPTAPSPRPSPHPPLATHSQAKSSRTAMSQPSSKHVLPVQPIVLRYERYQDCVFVKSTEGQEQGLTGLKHFTYMQKSLKIDTRPSLDHTNYLSADADLTDTDALSETHLRAQPPIDYPPQPLSMNTYTHPIYAGTTHNPAVFLAILRIAQLNLPGMNFTSALNHIPNVRPTDPLPILTPTAPGNFAPAPFLDTHNTQAPPPNEQIRVAFLPFFYGDRHAIAFWQPVQDLPRSAVLGSAFVTPCVEEDLRRYGLVSYISAEEVKCVGGEVGSRGVEGVELMERVAVERGRWVEKDIVEEWEEWRGAFRVCAVLWERRMALMRGLHEGS